MKVLIRASMLAAGLAFTLAVPVFADPGSTTHESTNTCRTDDVEGLTFCFTSETDTRTKVKRSGTSDVRISGTIHATVVDAAGNLVSSYDSKVREHDVVQLGSDGSAEYMKINVRLSEEITEGGVTSCTRTHVVVRGDSERVNHTSTTEGSC